MSYSPFHCRHDIGLNILNLGLGTKAAVESIDTVVAARSSCVGSGLGGNTNGVITIASGEVKSISFLGVENMGRVAVSGMKRRVPKKTRTLTKPDNNDENGEVVSNALMWVYGTLEIEDEVR